MGPGCCASQSCNALDVSKRLPLVRLQAWVRTFQLRNSRAFAAMDASAKTAVRKISRDERGANGQNFLETPMADWCLSCAELNITNPGAGADLWEEPLHKDGGASVLHLGLTLYGRRDVRFEQGLEKPDIYVLCFPGSIYIGQVTGAAHQVHHRAAAETELLDLGALGRCAVTVMLRTALFPHNRSRLRNTTPSPVGVFDALTSAFRQVMATEDMFLPTLGECMSELEASLPRDSCKEPPHKRKC